MIQESLSTRKQLWLDEIKKLSSLQGRKAQKERVEKLSHWIDNTSVKYFCFSSSQIDFKNNLIKVLRWKAPIECIYRLITTVPQRPPSLHWTPLPQADEAQITFKIAFPQSCFTRSELFELVKRISNVYKWQYQYEWSHGVLFRIEAVCFKVQNFFAKIAVIKHDPETLEMSGRIDNAIMDDNSDMVPMKSVWPYLSLAFTVAVEYLDELSSQYIIRIIPFGNIFYEENNALPRAFDLTQLLISNDLLKRVAYRDNGILYHLNLIQLFPGQFFLLFITVLHQIYLQLCWMETHKLKPKTIGEIGEMKARSNNNTVKEENNSRNDNVYLRLPERVHPKSCGRRVSFGTVKCIPQQSQMVEPDVELDNVPNEKPMGTKYEIMLDNYVNLILDETMREIKIS
ncbi:unnamed protein product [Onchocerca flexuosa]|uniref:Tudor domain-containing protein n=1 Tax=Onchocerca flexuosa TaxID=387005 RepID=A0A183H2U0_9BILA|nr:unnamed protein product [Onchocerca flexuosa]